MADVVPYSVHRLFQAALIDQELEECSISIMIINMIYLIFLLSYIRFVNFYLNNKDQMLSICGNSRYLHSDEANVYLSIVGEGAMAAECMD